jgi:hypothetical protein
MSRDLEYTAFIFCQSKSTGGVYPRDEAYRPHLLPGIEMS